MMFNTLKKYFGYDSFRPQQEAIIRQVLAGNDTLVLMPTGGGKSICYQIPALLLEGTAVVVSPLISLMKDQVESLKANGIAVAAINSHNSDSVNFCIRRDVLLGHIKILYISPERILLELPHLLSKIHVSLFAIDEAHCISQWGHDFRPDYAQLGQLKKLFPQVPIIALTATADKTTRDDIVKLLGIEQAQLFVGSFDRPNLSLQVLPNYSESERIKVILRIISRHERECGIIYCLSRKITEKVAARLRKVGILAGIYHAGLPAEERNRIQEDFIHERISVICATVAFGMGINKSNVRWVVHYNMPGSIESFYQEIGRAGRDGADSETVLFYNLQDIILRQQFVDESGQQKLNQDKLQRIKEYACAKICRRRILLNYFGEHTDCQCGNCDICAHPPVQFDGTILVQKALSAIIRTGQQISLHTTADILLGHFSKEVTEHEYHRIKTFGVGHDVPARDWNDYLLQMLQMGYFEIAYTEQKHLKITPLGEDVLYGRAKAKLVTLAPQTDVQPTRRTRTPSGRTHTSQHFPTAKEDGLLFEELWELRKALADKLAYPPNLILSEQSLHQLAILKPTTLNQLDSISGISEFKKQRFGQDFIDCIQQHLQS